MTAHESTLLPGRGRPPRRCPPCRSFSPALVEFYGACKDDVEIVFVSSDRDEASFGDYFGKFPWLAMVPGFTSNEHSARQAKLAAMLHIQVRGGSLLCERRVPVAVGTQFGFRLKQLGGKNGRSAA